MFVLQSLAHHLCLNLPQGVFIEVFKSVSLPAGFSHIKQALLQNLAALTRDLAAAL